MTVKAPLLLGGAAVLAVAPLLSMHAPSWAQQSRPSVQEPETLQRSLATNRLLLRDLAERRAVIEQSESANRDQALAFLDAQIERVGREVEALEARLGR